MFHGSNPIISWNTFIYILADVQYYPPIHQDSIDMSTICIYFTYVLKLKIRRIFYILFLAHILIYF